MPSDECQGDWVVTYPEGSVLEWPFIRVQGSLGQAKKVAEAMNGWFLCDYHVVEE